MFEENSRVTEVFINENFTRLISSIEKGEDYIPIRVHNMISTNDILKKIFTNATNYQTSILPQNCRFVKNFSNGSKVLVLEDEPKIRTVSFSYDPEVDLEFLKLNGKYEAYDLKPMTSPFKLSLSFPYIVYVFSLTKFNQLSDLYVYFRLSPITSLDDYLLRPNLPNIGNDFKVCLGLEKNQIMPISEKTSEIINAFWFNHFNRDYTEHCNAYSKVPEICDFFTWAHNTKVDPHFIYSVKWLEAKDTNLQYLIGKLSLNQSCGETFYFLTDLIISSPTDLEKPEEYQTTDITTSILIRGENQYDNVFLSIGDSVKYNDVSYYVDSFICNEITKTIIILKDDNNNTLEVTREKFIETFNNLQVVNPESIEIDDQIIRINDLVKFKESNNIQLVQKIIKARDGMYHLKIGNYFYLDSCFKNHKIEKIDSIEVNGINLENDKNYYLFDRVNDLLLRIKRVQYKGFHTGNSNKLNLHFRLVDTLEDLKYTYDGSFSIDYLIKEEDFKQEAISPHFYRIENQVFTNNFDTTLKSYLIKNIGIASDNVRAERCSYSSIFLYDYLSTLIKKNKNSITIPSFDQDLTYTIGDSVIYVDWENPEKMLDIRTISGFSLEDKEKLFMLKLKNDKETITVPLISIETGLGFFEKIRHVCNQINDLKVGTKVKAKNREIYDFPMKDCNEIKAFIIDDIHPLVLFSNYRTLLLKDVNENNFNFITEESKNYQKAKISDPYLEKLKVQDGDLFHDKKNLYIIVNVSRAATTTKHYIKMGVEPRYSRYTNRFYMRSDTENRSGILLPRISPNRLKELRTTFGIPSIFGNIVLQEPQVQKSFGIRRERID